MTVAQLIKSAAAALREAGCEDVEFEALQLVSFVLDIDHHSIRMMGDRQVESSDEAKTDSLIAQRISGRPLQYILGQWEFFGLPFYVGEGVLIPRADTEILVESALKFINQTGAKDIIDLCSGSGCIAVSIAKNAPQTRVTAVEKFDLPYDFTVRNIGQNKAYNVTAVKSDLFGGAGDMQCDVLLSNPPYITAKDMGDLSREVLCEPHTALFGGEDGLDFYRAIAELWLPCIRQGGAVFVEVGYDQADAVVEIFKAAALADIQKIKDISGVERVVYARKEGFENGKGSKEH